MLALAALVAAIPCVGQTTAELLQKGIYAQETEGNLDHAILIYRQIVNSAPSQRDLAAQAQYRLAQTLLQKGNLTEASREFERLARDYADYSSLVSSLAGQMRGPFYLSVNPAGADIEKARKLAAAGGAMVIPMAEFDPSKPVTLTGKISQIQWTNPLAWLKLETANGDYSVRLGAPKTMVGTGKVTKNAFQLGMDVTITGILANNGSQTALANTVTSQGNLIFDHAWLNSPVVMAPAQ
jgi:tetratricopeptide (TPR) repeat protein